MKKENKELLAMAMVMIIIYVCVTVSQVIIVAKSLDVDYYDCKHVLESLQED